MKTEEINIRDPFILVDNNTYYLYRTCGSKGVEVLKSKDLKNWSEPTIAYQNSNKDYCGNYFYAPEVHKYNGKFYLITSCKSKKYGVDLITIYVSDYPDGPFVENGSQITTTENNCIDGTLFVEDNVPYLIYSSWELEKCNMVKMYAAKLDEKLSKIIETPKFLFKGDDLLYTKDIVCEGPYVFKDKNDLFIIWSNYKNYHYLEAISKSMTGKIEGPYIHCETPLYEKDENNEYDGGHGMVFEDLNGNRKFILHTPNTYFLPEKEKECAPKEHILIKNILFGNKFPILK